MILPENDYQILQLSSAFYQHYKSPPYHEIINNSKYIDDKNIIIDKDEYKETIQYFSKIKKQALQYVEDYIAHVRGTNPLSYQEFNRKYNYSTLKYFHNELGI